MQQLTIGEALKETGQRRATEAALEWHEQALDWIRSSADRFTADDLVLSVGLPNVSASNKNNAVGAVFSAARRQRLIRRVDWTQSTRPESHGRVVAVWQKI